VDGRRGRYKIRQQIPFGDDNWNSNGNGKGGALKFESPKGWCWMDFFGILHCVQDDGKK
jgi:hypothetical protein